MYDARVDGTTVAENQYPTWDLHVENGVCPLLSDSAEAQQRANVSAFIQTGSVPQLPDYGVNWTAFFTHIITFGELDAMIRQALKITDSSGFSPSYDVSGDSLATTIKRSAS